MWIGLDRKIDHGRIASALERYFVGYTVRVYEDDLPPNAWPNVPVKKEMDVGFPITLTFYTLNKNHEYQICLNLAKYLSVNLECKTICDGGMHGDDNSPFWDVLWDHGVPYLVDDFEAGEEDNLKDIKIIRELRIVTEEIKDKITT